MQIEKDTPSFEDNRAACNWAAGAMETLDGDGGLALKDQTIWNDVFENGIDLNRAWKKRRAQK